VIVRQATVDDLDLIAPMFDAYRQFYKQSPDLALSRSFLLDRFQHSQSVIFLALDEDGTPLGFTQLYPSFSSTAAKRIFVLNDLFVAPKARRRKAGHALLSAAAEYGKKVGAARLTLSTALDNSTAQAHYEYSGWQRDRVFCVYTLPL
jgi:GNAT superfamily N-acetyltransferase